MTHVNTGIRKILELPMVYNLFHNITGGNAFRSEYFSKYFSLDDGAKVLDIGCGSGVMLENVKSHIDYTGVDFEEGYIEFCKEKYGDRGQFFQEKVGEVIREEWLDNFDAMNAHGLIHHLTDEDSEVLLSTAYKYLKPGGYLVTFDTTYHDNQSSISRWFVYKDRGQNVKHTSEYLKLAEKHFDKVEGKIYTNYSRLPYSAYAMKMIKS